MVVPAVLPVVAEALVVRLLRGPLASPDERQAAVTRVRATGTETGAHVPEKQTDRKQKNEQKRRPRME